MRQRPHRPILPLAALVVAVAQLGVPTGGIVLAAPTPGAVPPAGATATPPAWVTQPGQMYLDDQAHAKSHLSFAPGGPVTVPYTPRSTDRWSVGGSAPRTIPLATGSPAGTNTTGSTALVGRSAPALATTAAAPGLDREVFGFLGYWGLTDPIDYGGVTTLAYFGLNATATGGFVSDSGLSGWDSSALTSVIDTAHSHGVRVVLVAKCFGWSASGNATCTSLLSSSDARQALATNLASQVAARGADGVNFDFEPIPNGQSQDFVDLVRRTRAAVNARALGYELTVDSLGWIGPQSYQQTSGYDVAGLTASGAADAMVIMGYDYKGADSGIAGSIDPLGGPTYDLNATLTAYLSYTSPSHVILALPWYGRAWSTTTTAAGSATVAGTATLAEPCSVAADYAYIVEQLVPGAQDSWYPTEASPYLLYPQPPTSCHPSTTDWRQLYFDDVQSLGQRYDLINARDLRGTGMWDLSKVVGASGLHDELYSLIKAKFVAQPGTYTPLGPTRLLDTRSGIGLSGVFRAGVPRTLKIAGTGFVPVGATAVTVNLTVTGQTAGGYLALTRAPTATPATSTLNFPRGDTRANGATVPLAADGTLAIVFVAPAGATTNVVLDITGSFP